MFTTFFFFIFDNQSNHKLLVNSFSKSFTTKSSIHNSRVKLHIQLNSLDDLETFMMVAKMNTIRVSYLWQQIVFQLDMKNAFIHEDLEKEVKMGIQPRSEQISRENMVFK